MKSSSPNFEEISSTTNKSVSLSGFNYRSPFSLFPSSRLSITEFNSMSDSASSLNGLLFHFRLASKTPTRHFHLLYLPTRPPLNNTNMAADCGSSVPCVDKETSSPPYSRNTALPAPLSPGLPDIMEQQIAMDEQRGQQSPLSISSEDAKLFGLEKRKFVGGLARLIC